MGSVVLVIIHNHPHYANIATLDRLYGSRFRHIRHLAPFFTGSASHVVPVYENSRCFQGYVSQAVSRIVDDAFDHYLFVADDLLLRPDISEDTYRERLRLGPEACFLPGFVELHRLTEYWPRATEAARWNPNVLGAQIVGLLPDASTAAARFARFGLTAEPLTYFQVMNRQPATDAERRVRYAMRYPLVGGYSDIFAVSRRCIRPFAHLCGLFAVGRLFVELAIPTALVLAADEIVTEQALPYQGRALWTAEDRAILDRYGGSLRRLLDEFPDQHLYLHPIKLSQWDTAPWGTASSSPR